MVNHKRIEQTEEEDRPRTCIWTVEADGKDVPCGEKVFARGCCQSHYHACWALVKDKTKPGITWETLQEQRLALPPKKRRTDATSEARRRILGLLDGTGGKRMKRRSANTKSG